MNVQDTFCIGKTMTCDMCFVPAATKAAQLSTGLRLLLVLTWMNELEWMNFAL